MVAQGLVTCDGFQGLRALVRPKAARRRRRGPGIAGAGRWSLVREAEPDAGDVLIEAVARALLDRYGVIFRALLQRESRHLPPWRELVRSLRRMEARGDVRGGRFVNGFGGEQFAWPGAVAALRRARTADQDLEVVVPAVDPLNLTGIITPGDRVPGTPRNRVLYRGGEPIAVQVGGNFRALDQLDAAAEWSARHALVRNDPRLPYLQPPARSI
jgi:ATP-dependent Lhr-like helicase